MWDIKHKSAGHRWDNNTISLVSIILIEVIIARLESEEPAGLIGS